MTHSRRSRLLISIHDAAWISSEFAAALSRRFDVRVMQVALPLPQRSSGRFVSKPEVLVIELLTFLRLVARPRLLRGNWRFACFSGHFGALLYLRCRRALGRGRRGYLLNFYLHSLGQAPLVKRLLAVLLTDDIRILAHTYGDAEYFRQFLPAENVKRIPYCQSASKFVAPEEVQLSTYVFSGGWTNRDYDALFRCATRLPHIPFVVVASKHSPFSEPIPPNVELYRDIDVSDFDRLMSRARMVVIPLAEDVGSSGQMVLLRAMEFGKTTIVPALGAVVDYFEDGVTGVLYAHGDEEALAATIRDFYPNEELVTRIGAAARGSYLAQFTPPNAYRPVAEYLSE